MPSPIYMKVKGATQGDITTDANTADSIGGGWQEGFEDFFLVQRLSHNLTVPRDPHSGQPSGRRVHQPLTVTKILDKSSPMLAIALTTGEALPECELHYYRTSELGKQEHYFTVKLEDALLTDITHEVPDIKMPENQPLGHLETLMFSYRKIIWEHVVSGTTGEDDWRVTNS